MSDMGPREPDNSMVICPNCTCQFVAIPVDVQTELAQYKRRAEHPASMLEWANGLQVELSAVKKQLARYTSVTRENFGYQEGLDNTIAMACYGEYLRRLSIKEEAPKMSSIKPPLGDHAYYEVLTAEDEIAHLKRQCDRYRAVLEQCREVMVPAHALYSSASFQLVIQLLHELLGDQSVTRENFGYVEGADNTVAMALYEEYLRRTKP